jgi:hypothetical protein
VDIWGLGCIIAELLTGHKAFPTDSATLEYYSSNATPSSLVLDIVFKKDSITTVLHDMLHREPGIRPSAILCSTFSQFSRNCLDQKKNAGLHVPNQPVEIADDDWELGFSWTNRDADAEPVIFSLEGEKQVTGCTVLDAIINKPNSRIVLLCADDDDDRLVVKLSTTSGSILWEEKDLMVTVPASNVIFPSFDNHGIHLVVYINAKITILNVLTGTLMNSFSLDKVIPTALAITRDAKSIGIATNSKVHPTDVDMGLYKLRTPDGKATHTVHCIVLLGEHHVKLGYIANCRRIAASTTNDTGIYSDGASTWCFDVSSRTKVSDFKSGPRWPLREVHLSNITTGNEECHILQLRRRGGDDTNFYVFTGGGQSKGEFSCGRGIIAFVDDGLVWLNEKYEVRYWSPGQSKTVKVGAFEGIDLPVLESIKGIVLGESQIILVQDDGCFVYGRDSSLIDVRMRLS